MVDGFRLRAVNWVRHVIRHNGAAIDIWSQDDKRLTRLISTVEVVLDLSRTQAPTSTGDGCLATNAVNSLRVF
jgi:hypothetical protein